MPQGVGTARAGPIERTKRWELSRNKIKKRVEMIEKVM